MNIDLTPITSSAVYQKDKAKLLTTGKKRSLQIWFLLPMIFLPFLWPVLIYLYFRWHSKWKVEYAQRLQAINEFAKINNFTYIDNMGKPIVGHEPKKSYNLPFEAIDMLNACELKGTVDEFTFTYSVSTIVVKVSKGDSHHPYNIFTIELPVELPKVFINSKLNNVSIFDAAALNFIDAEDHQLEGDFPQYYTVRIEKNEQIDMYSILTPEVMDTLKRNNQFDVWLSGNQLSLITFGDLDRYFAAIPQVFENAFILMREIDRIARALRQK